MSKQSSCAAIWIHVCEKSLKVRWTPPYLRLPASNDWRSTPTTLHSIPSAGSPPPGKGPWPSKHLPTQLLRLSLRRSMMVRRVPKSNVSVHSRHGLKVDARSHLDASHALKGPNSSCLVTSLRPKAASLCAIASREDFTKRRLWASNLQT